MIVVDFILALVFFVISLFLQFVPIEPLYFYHETTNLDAPMRTEWLSIKQFYAMIIILPILVLALMYFTLFRGKPISRFFRMVCLAIFSVSTSSIICSIIHIIVGTPRIDSIEMCRTKNVSFSVCREVLTKFETVQQFNSFPAVEPAMAMTIAVIFMCIVELPPGFGFVEMILKFILVTWGLLIASVGVVNSSYRIHDVVAGIFIGFIVGVVSIFTYRRDLEREQNMKEFTDASSDASFRVSAPKLF